MVLMTRRRPLLVEYLRGSLNVLNYRKSTLLGAALTRFMVAIEGSICRGTNSRVRRRVWNLAWVVLEIGVIARITGAKLLLVRRDTNLGWKIRVVFINIHIFSIKA
jgi:hypothetical protein